MLRPLVALLILALPALDGVPAAPHAHDPCPEAAAPEPFVSLPAWIENLHFHAGALWTAGDGGLHRHTPQGETSQVPDLGGYGGAMVTGPDGALYVRAGTTEVWRFSSPTAPHQVVATGLPDVNGLAVDAAGNLYTSSTPGHRIYRLPAGDPANWTEWAEVYSPNGLVVDDAAGLIYAAQTTDGRSTLAAVPLHDPTGVRTVASLSFGAAQADFFERPPIVRPVPPSDPQSPLLPKGVDDLALGADGMLYVTAFLTGEVLRVDPATGASCAVAAGLGGPTSVRVAQGFGEQDGLLFVSEVGSAAELFTPLRNPFTPGGVRVVPVHVGGPGTAGEPESAQPAASSRATPGVAAGAALVLVALLRRR